MSDTPDFNLEHELSRLTEWHGRAPGLWRRALAMGGIGRGWRGRLVRWASVGAVAAAVLLVATLVVLPGLSSARRSSFAGGPYEAGERMRAPIQHILPEEGETRPVATTVDKGVAVGYAPRRGPVVVGDVVGRRKYELTAGTAFYGESDGDGQADIGRAVDEGVGTIPPGAERQVVRKATIELGAKDVRATFLKAQQLVSEARGEYVQDSGITGSGGHVEANLTLRVAADRLPAVLIELGELGEVRSQKTSGEDVTAQVVDVEARLRNERAVEAELLTLLEKRQDSPLKEVLELRASIGNVRETIEQLTAQREQLGRLVSLATVLVIIRPSDAPVVSDAGLWAYFTHAVQRAWNDGLRLLAKTLAGIVGVLVGGLVWWVLLAVLIVVGVRVFRRKRT